MEFRLRSRSGFVVEGLGFKSGSGVFVEVWVLVYVEVWVLSRGLGFFRGGVWV